MALTIPQCVLQGAVCVTGVKRTEPLLHNVTVQRWQCATPPLLLIPPANPSAGLLSTVITHPQHWHTSPRTSTPDSLHIHTHAQLECTLHKKFNVAVVLYGMANMGIKFLKVSVLSFTKTFYSLTIMFYWYSTLMQRGTAWQHYCKLQPKKEMNSDKKSNGWYTVVPWYIKNRQSNSKKVSSEY